MKVSVVTIVYNDVANIERTLQSVISQTYCDIEYIVVDGASTDGTSEIIGRYLSNLNKYICEKDTGIYNAMNKGLQVASGDYVIFMNSGDRFSSNSVVSQICAMVGERRPAMIYGHYHECVGDNIISTRSCRKPSKIWYGPVASHQSTLYNIDFIRHNSISYDENYRIAADYKFSLQTLMLSGGDAIQVDVCVSDFDTSGASNTNMDLGLNEANRARREILGWSPLQCGAMKYLLLSARYAKKYVRPLYNMLRR